MGFTHWGVILFAGALAKTVVQFRDVPLDDRDANWIIRNFRHNLWVCMENSPRELSDHDISTTTDLMYKLDLYILVLEQRQEDHRW